MPTPRSQSTDVKHLRTEPSVGAEIREVRKARGLTLKDLSEKTGRSVAYLSRIERGDSRISVDLLSDIGDALNVDPKWFFPTRTGTGFHERNSVVRANARRPLSNLYTRTTEELGFEDELLSSTLAGGFYMMMSTFPPDTDNNSAPREGYVFEGEQHGVVIKGQVELTLDNTEVIKLNSGDSFSYSTEIPHRFRNASDEEAIMVWTMSPVRISW